MRVPDRVGLLLVTRGFSAIHIKTRQTLQFANFSGAPSAASSLSLVD